VVQGAPHIKFFLLVAVLSAKVALTAVGLGALSSNLPHADSVDKALEVTTNTLAAELVALTDLKGADTEKKGVDALISSVLNTIKSPDLPQAGAVASPDMQQQVNQILDDDVAKEMYQAVLNIIFDKTTEADRQTGIGGLKRHLNRDQGVRNTHRPANTVIWLCPHCSDLFEKNCQTAASSLQTSTPSQAVSPSRRRTVSL